MKTTVPQRSLSLETRKRLQRLRLAQWSPQQAPPAPTTIPLAMTRHALAIANGQRPCLASLLAEAATRAQTLNPVAP